MATEKQFPYTPVPKSLKRLLETIPTIGTPTKWTLRLVRGDYLTS
jgi:hypothetical protein